MEVKESKMKHTRVLNTVEEEWGRSIVYAIESAPSVQKSSAPCLALDRSSNVTFKEKVVLPTEQIVVDNDNGDETELDADRYRLRNFQSLMMPTILEDSITKMRILASSNNEMKITKTMADMPLLLALKYRVQQPAVKDELDGIDFKNLRCSEYKLNKLEADRNFVEKVLTDTYVDLSLSKSYQALVEHNNKITDRQDYRKFLIEDEATNKATRRDLAKQLRQQRNHFKSVIYDMDVTIDALKTQVEDANLLAEIRSRYVEYWQNARTEQHIQTIADKESLPSNNIEYFKQRSDHEQRVHTEVELLINIAINETLEKVEQWMEKYDKDMEAVDLKIQIKKNDYQNQLDKRIYFEETIAKHDDLMKNWIHFKEEREKLRQYREKMTKSAIVVQAWWRGLLVRLQLGPYKVSKKKGGKKKK